MSGSGTELKLLARRMVAILDNDYCQEAHAKHSFLFLFGYGLESDS